MDSFEASRRALVLRRLRFCALFSIFPIGFALVLNLAFMHDRLGERVLMLALEGAMSLGMLVLLRLRLPWVERHAVALSVVFASVVYAGMLWGISLSPQHLGLLIGVVVAAMFATAQLYPWGGPVQALSAASLAAGFLWILPPDLAAGGLPQIVLVLTVAVGLSVASAVSFERYRRDHLRMVEEVRRATEAKSSFLANMSHEIRTPLNAVVGMADLLRDTPLTADQVEFVGTIRASSDALLALINDILDFSKIEAGGIELESVPFGVAGCVEEAIDVVAQKAGEKGLDLAYELDDSVPAGLVGDGNRLRQVLVNLLNNAVKFTERGEIVVSATGTRLPDGRHELTFAVRDTGVGIPSDRVEHIFDAFTQADASTTRKYGGTGLGLAISRRFIERMGGTLTVESTPGRGSTFRFRVRGHAVDVAAGPSPVVAAGALAGKRALVVDDSPAQLGFLTRQLGRLGMAVRATPDAREAMQWVRSGEPFDVALVDLHLAQIDGRPLAEQLRRERPPERLPLVLLSPLGARTARPADAFAATLSKPVKPAALARCVTRACAGRAPERIEPPRAAALDRSLGERLGLRVLLAEDNRVNQRVALKLLERMGIHAAVAADGHEAVAALESAPYDVVLMDVQMPEMGGIEATREIRRRRPREEGPWIIALTANATHEDRDACMAAGMDDYLAKPVAPPLLAAALERAARSGAARSRIDEPAAAKRA